MAQAFQIDPIANQHVRDKFDCGEPALDNYLAYHARKNDRKGVAKSFVVLDDHNQVLGYYSLSAAQIEFDHLPAEHHKQLPRYPVPAARIGKLAVDRAMQGRGLGGWLLVDALRRILAAADQMGVLVVIVDAKSERAKQFYVHYGFIELVNDPMTLFLPLETVRKSFEIKD